MHISFSIRGRWSCWSLIFCSSLLFWQSGYLKTTDFASCTKLEARWCTVSTEIVGLTWDLLLEGEWETCAQMAKERTCRKNVLIEMSLAWWKVLQRVSFQKSCRNLPCHRSKCHSYVVRRHIMCVCWQLWSHCHVRIPGELCVFKRLSLRKSQSTAFFYRRAGKH